MTRVSVICLSLALFSAAFGQQPGTFASGTANTQYNYGYPQQQQPINSPNNNFNGLNSGYNSGGSQNPGTNIYGNNYNAQQPQSQQGFMNQQYALQPLITQQNVTMNRSTVVSGGGVNIQLRLNTYTNQQFALPNGLRCVCPSTWSDTCSKELIAFVCRLSFTIIISAPDQSVKYFATDFISLPVNSGQISAQSQPQNSSFVQLYSFDMDSKPSAIDIFAHDFGPAINVSTGVVIPLTVIHADTFILPLKDVLPSPSGAIQPPLQNTMLTGRLMSTSLSLDYAISCRGSLVGENCDLNCTQSSRNSAKAICTSNTTGFFSICDYTANKQVQNCLNCPWGIGEEAYCRDSFGGALNPSSAGLVSTSYKTWTIILGIASCILLVLFVIVLIYSCVLASRSRESNAPGHNYRSSQRRHEGSAQQSLLQSPNIINNGGHMERPTAPPRSHPPPLDARPPKSSIRRANYAPPAHLGGAASLNDTLNSSFSSVPMPPSRSADV